MVCVIGELPVWTRICKTICGKLWTREMSVLNASASNVGTEVEEDEDNGRFEILSEILINSVLVVVCSLVDSSV